MRWRKPKSKRRAELLGGAKKRIAELVDGNPARRAIAPNVLALLDQIVLDGQPTPQANPHDGIGVEVAWLANNWYIGLIVDEDEWDLWAEDPDSVELFSARGMSGTLLDRDTLRWTQHLLASMGDMILGWKT